MAANGDPHYNELTISRTLADFGERMQAKRERTNEKSKLLFREGSILIEYYSVITGL